MPFPQFQQVSGQQEKPGLRLWLQSWVTLESHIPICEMRIRKCHTRTLWVNNRGLWLRFQHSPRAREAHLFFTTQSRQVTQISLTLLSTKVREKHSPKHLSGGKGVYEYVIFFFFFFSPNTNGNKLPMKLKCLGWFDCCAKISQDRNLNINCSACFSYDRKNRLGRGKSGSMGWECFHNFLLKLQVKLIHSPKMFGFIKWIQC